MRARLLPLLLAAALVACGPDAPPTVHFAWQGSVGEAGWVRVRNINGRVQVLRSPDARVTVGATVRTGGRQPRWVRDSSAAGVTLCVTFDGGDDCSRLSPGKRGLLRQLWGMIAGGGGPSDVRYTLYVPADAGVDVETVNGAVEIESVLREARVHTVNGAIRATARVTGFDAKAVNGSVEATLDLAGAQPVAIETVNGSVTAELPASLAGDVSLQTVNGKVASDFALAAEGKKSLRGTLGGGGRTVSLRTVNGSVELRRRG